MKTCNSIKIDGVVDDVAKNTETDQDANSGSQQNDECPFMRIQIDCFTDTFFNLDELDYLRSHETHQLCFGSMLAVKLPDLCRYVDESLWYCRKPGDWDPLILPDSSDAPWSALFGDEGLRFGVEIEGNWIERTRESLLRVAERIEPAATRGIRLAAIADEIRELATRISESSDALASRFRSSGRTADGQISVEGLTIADSITDALVNIDTTLDMIESLAESLEEMAEERNS